MPEFEVVRRGVDRRQVEEWGSKLTGLIEQERRRADQAEQALYRMQLEAKGTPSFSHLGTHVADVIGEAGRSAEKMLVDAADRAQEVVDEAEAEAAEIVTAAEAQAGEIQGAARQDAEQLWKETERACAAVEGETRRLEDLRRRTHEQLGQMHGHLESVLDEIRLGIDDAHDVNEEQSGPEPAEPLTLGEPAAGGRQARPANATAEATLPGVAEAKPAPGMRA